MKKFSFILIATILLSGLFNLSFAQVEKPNTDKHELKIVVDPRIELLSTVQLLSGYGLIGDFEFTYKQDVITYFSKYKDHRVVTLFEKMSQNFNCDAPPTAMLNVCDPP